MQLAKHKADLAEQTSLSATLNSPDSDKLVLVDPKRAGQCGVRSSTDEQWYRAVIGRLEDGTATVTLVNFGTLETVMTDELQYIRPEVLRQAPSATHCCLAGLHDNAEWTLDENDVFLKKTQDKDLFLTLNRDNTGHTEAQLMDESVNIASLFPRRMTLTAIVEKLPGDGNSKITYAEHQGWAEEAQRMFAASAMDKTLLHSLYLPKRHTSSLLCRTSPGNGWVCSSAPARLGR